MKKSTRILICMAAVAGVGSALCLSSCSVAPKNAAPVRQFDITRYAGTWYEIARIEFRHERNMNNVSAQYSIRPDGKVNVLNSGYNYKKQNWEKAEGKAKFRGAHNVGALKVSFFGPFYSGYNVVALDEQYRYALVAGKNLDYLWILSREKNIPKDVKESYLNIARNIGYDTSRLVWVNHDRNDNPYLQ